jgi:hypothetical protein
MLRVFPAACKSRSAPADSYGNIRIGPVQIQQLDVIGRQSAQALFTLASHRLGPAIVDELIPFQVDATLCGDHHFVAAPFEGSAD